MNWKIFFNLLKEAIKHWSEKKSSRLSAALTYYILFSLAPLLVIATAIAGLAFGQSAAEAEIVRLIEGVVGNGNAGTIPAIITNSLNPTSGVVATILGSLVLLLGASNAFVYLQEALKSIWEVPPKPEKHWLQNILRMRLMAMLVVLVNGFVLLLALTAITVLSTLNQLIKLPAIGVFDLVQVLSQAITFGLMTLILGWLYKALPQAEASWREVWAGAAIATFLLYVFNSLIGLYFKFSSLETVYGAAGSLVMLLFWAYNSAQILFFGAAFSKVYADNRRAKKTSAV